MVATQRWASARLTRTSAIRSSFLDGVGQDPDFGFREPHVALGIGDQNSLRFLGLELENATPICPTLDLGAELGRWIRPRFGNPRRMVRLIQVDTVDQVGAERPNFVPS